MARFLDEGVFALPRLEKISVEPEHMSSIPALRVKLTIRNQKQESIFIPSFPCQLFVEVPGGNLQLIGTGVAHLPTGSREDHPEFIGRKQFDCVFFLDWSTLALIEKGLQTRVKSDVYFRIGAQVDFAIVSGSAPKIQMVWSHERLEQQRVEVARSTWIRWQERWGRDLRLITLSSSLAGKLELLRQKHGYMDYEELIGRLVDRVEDIGSPPSQLLCTLPDNKYIKSKFDELLAGMDASDEVLVSGYIDGGGLNAILAVLKRGIPVRILARKSNEKGVKDAMGQLKRQGATIQYNNMMHARVMVFGNSAAIVGSADPKTDSFDNNLNLLTQIFKGYVFLSIW